METQPTIKDWIIVLVILAAPIVNIGFLIHWAINKDDYRKNYSKAILIMFSISICFAILLGTILSGKSSDTSSNSSSNYYYHKERDMELHNDLELLDIDIIFEGDGYEVLGIEYGNNIIVGRVRNNSTTTTHTSFDIDVNIYDQDDSIVDTVIIENYTKLPPGEIYKFSKELPRYNTSNGPNYDRPFYKAKFIEFVYPRY